MKPIARYRCCARELGKSGRRRHHAQQRKWLRLFSAEALQKLRSNAVDIIGVDAIKFEGCAAVRARAQRIDPRDTGVQPPARKFWWAFEDETEKSSLPELSARASPRDREHTRICYIMVRPRRSNYS